MTLARLHLDPEPSAGAADRTPPRSRGAGRAGRAATALVAAGLVLGLTGSALAGTFDSDTDTVLAELDFQRFEGRARFCEGSDGTYDQEMGVASGTATGDPRLTGDFELHFKSLDRLTEDGHVGTVGGTFRVTDPGTGRKKVDAEFLLVQDQGVERGLVFGKVADAGRGPSEETMGAGRLLGGFEVIFLDTPEGFDVVGRIGGEAGSLTMPAVIQQGGCSGSYETYAFDLPLTGG